MSNIQDPLTRLFKKQRIVFWYDTDKELRSDFEAVELPGVNKIELSNNEFAVKYRLLRKEPDSQFLLYHEGPQPEDMNNWLLDVLLAHGEFRTDQASIYLGELGLGPEYSELVQGHLEFFNAVKRRDGLKKLLQNNESHGAVRIKMLAVCSNAEPRIDVILESLLDELAAEKKDKFKTIQRCGLDYFFYEQLKRHYGYESEKKSVHDFVIELFQSCYEMELGRTPTLGNDSMIFLKRWKDSIRHRSAFETLSEECAGILGIEQDLQDRDYKTLMEMDYFRLIDQKIISALVHAVADRTISTGECTLLIRSRKQSHWYPEFSDLYEAVDVASNFIHELDTMDLQIDQFASGIERYALSWFRLDQLYRKFIYHSRKPGLPSLLGKLSNQIEDQYTNIFLLQLGDNWQKLVDDRTSWTSPLIPLQNQFFKKWVEKPFLTKNRKVVVIISDALRYEAGEELLRLIRKEDRYEAQIETMLGMLPSYTQLGMAALLPNKELGFAEDSSQVLVDGSSTVGTVNRGKVLAKGVSGETATIRADKLIQLNRDECRELFRDHKVVYVYHNLIDATGDKKESEGRVFEAVQETLAELVQVIKKLAAANATNMLITSDHGFLYQNRVLDESDFSSAEPTGETIIHSDRRFIIGKGLKEQPGLRHFTSQELGLVGDSDVQVSKSINRMRLKGSGSRFVHGGATLQELVLPVIRVNKKRQSDVCNVEIDILRSGSSVITTGQLSVAFYQIEPVSGKKHPRTLRAGIYDKDGELISDKHELIFDFMSDQAREREMIIRFLLSRNADEANGQTVYLKLEENVAGTSKYRDYKSISYTMQQSFTTDFDF
jgi:uncharacterized protein (TIGR02687 family)